MREGEAGSATKGGDGAAPPPVHGVKRPAPVAPRAVQGAAAPHSINLLDLPTEMLLTILERLLALDPITLLGSIPMVCRRMRAVCAGVRGEFDMRGEWGWLDRRGLDDARAWGVVEEALASASLHFPRTRGLWTFSKWPLHHACKAGLVAAARRLLDEQSKHGLETVEIFDPRLNAWVLAKRADLDRADDVDVTPLYVACREGHVSIVQLLVDNGADVDHANLVGESPLFMACKGGHLDVAQVLVDEEAVVDQLSSFGTPLYAACWNGHLEVVRLLVENWADVDKATDYGETPLSFACEEGHLEVARLLVDKGADINKVNNRGATPLLAACRYNRPAVVQLLVEKGADVNKADNGGMTPLAATRSGDLSALLRSAGAR